MDVPADMEITDLTPHMHFRGKHVLVEVARPDGSTQTLIDRHWDFKQQTTLVFDDPVLVEAGSRIHAWFTWDNSGSSDSGHDGHGGHGGHGGGDNSEPVEINWGWGSSDEMAEVWIGFVPVRSVLFPAPPRIVTVSA